MIVATHRDHQSRTSSTSWSRVTRRGTRTFRDFIQGDYTYQRALFRAVLHLQQRRSEATSMALRVTVDVPDVV
jgi:hypothetical protein